MEARRFMKEANMGKKFTDAEKIFFIVKRLNFRAKRQKKDEKKRKKRIIFEKGVDRYFRMCYN